MFAALTRLRRLAKVDFSHNLITDVGMDAITEEIRGLRRSLLTSLRLNGNQIGNEGAMGLFRALGRENQVSDIGLAENALKEDFAAELEAWLKSQRARDVGHSHMLTKIRLDGNGLTLKGFRDVEAQVLIN